MGLSSNRVSVLVLYLTMVNLWLCVSWGLSDQPGMIRHNLRSPRHAADIYGRWIKIVIAFSLSPYNWTRVLVSMKRMTV